MTMSASRARFALTLLWHVAFAVGLAIAVHLYLTDWVEADNLEACLKQLNSLYVPYVGVMATFYFTRSVADDIGAAPSRFALAIATSLAWNVFVLLFLVRLEFGRGTIEEAIEQMASTGRLLSWLVAPAVGYYFAQPAKK